MTAALFVPAQRLDHGVVDDHGLLAVQLAGRRRSGDVGGHDRVLGVFQEAPHRASGRTAEHGVHLVGVDLGAKRGNQVDA